MSLPFIDRHSLEVAVPPEAVWRALLELLDRPPAGGLSAVFVRLLGCQDTARSGPGPLALGSTLVGFHIDQFQPTHLLVLAGRHRFSRYQLTFELQAVGEARACLTVLTHAEFPGLLGRFYRLLVISSRIHLLVTRLVLGSIGRRAIRRSDGPQLGLSRN